MDNHLIVEYLIHFGLTRQEALIYTTLIKHSKLTGYEISKLTGISRSNAYGGLAGLVDKGAAYLIESDVTRYVPVDVEEFCNNKIRNLVMEQSYLMENMPRAIVDEEGYITITGDGHIFDKIGNMLTKTEKRIYLSMSSKYLDKITPMLSELLDKGINIYIITDKMTQLEGAKIYITEDKGNQIGLIADSVTVLTGEYGLGMDSKCLYSGQKNFVRVFKDSLANEIKLIQIKEEK